MSPSLSRSSTNAALSGLVALVALTACEGCNDDETCGVMGAPTSGLLASSVDVTLNYGEFTAGANNDCPANDPDEPEGLISLSIFGRQVGGEGLITLCIPRPDLLGEPDRSLGSDITGVDIRLVDVVGNVDSCTYELDPTRIPTGTGTGEGVCKAATDPAGFALILDGAISLKRTCGATIDTIGVTLAGRVAVEAIQL